MNTAVLLYSIVVACSLINVAVGFPAPTPSSYSDQKIKLCDSLLTVTIIEICRAHDFDPPIIYHGPGQDVRNFYLYEECCFKECTVNDVVNQFCGEERSITISFPETESMNVTSLTTIPSDITYTTDQLDNESTYAVIPTTNSKTTIKNKS